MTTMASTSQQNDSNQSQQAVPSTSNTTTSHHVINTTTITPNKQQKQTNNEKNISNQTTNQSSVQSIHGKKRKTGTVSGSGGPSGSGAQNRSGIGGQMGDGMAMWTRLTGAPAWDLQPNDTHSQTFTGRCRLFVANLPSSVTEESLRALFEPYGAVSEIYIGKGNTFAFVKMDTRLNAESAKQALDGRPMDNRTLRVRLAAHAAAIRVSNLPPIVSNELLHLAFSSFGLVERAIVSADDRGRSVGEGIVEFARKSSAQAALKKCQNECLLLSSSPIPVVVTALESRDEEEGVPEKSVIHSPEYRIEREIGPRFAEPGSLEWEMARKWKQLSTIEIQRREALEAEIRDARDALKSQMEYLKIDETTKQLRERLRQMETQSQKLCQEREQRIETERRREEQRRTQELVLRQQEEALLRRGHDLDHDVTALRRQESELRQQANALQQLLDRQEQALRQMNQSDIRGGVMSGVGVATVGVDPINAIQSHNYGQSHSGLINENITTHSHSNPLMFSANNSGIGQQLTTNTSHGQSYGQSGHSSDSLMSGGHGAHGGAHHHQQQQQHHQQSQRNTYVGQQIGGVANIRHSLQSQQHSNAFKRFRR